jgi:Virulence factor
MGGAWHRTGAVGTWLNGLLWIRVKGCGTKVPVSAHVDTASEYGSESVARVQILRWQDVPSVVKAFDDDGSSVSAQLPDWFQQEIDRVAMEQGLAGSDAYLEQWEWRDLGERDGSDAEVAEQVEAELVARASGGGSPPPPAG